MEGKYKFDFTDFTVADHAEFLRLIALIKPKESLTSMLFGVKEELVVDDQIHFMADLLTLIAKFTDGYTLYDVCIGEESALVGDFVAAWSAEIKAVYGEG